MKTDVELEDVGFLGGDAVVLSDPWGPVRSLGDGGSANGEGRRRC